MDLGLRKKRVVVTGGGRSIGRAIAQTFSQEGATVAVCGRSEVVMAEARDRGWAAEAFDITDPESARAGLSALISRLGGLDILVLNASAVSTDRSEAGWRTMVETDLLASQRLIEVARPHLEASAKAGDAAIVMVSSVSAIETNGPNPYGAVKAAMIHFSKGLAREGAAVGLRCNVVSPGMVYTADGTWGQVEREQPELFREMRARNPTGRMATAEEVAAAVVFLASPRSSYTSGANLVVDGAKSVRVNF